MQPPRGACSWSPLDGRDRAWWMGLYHRRRQCRPRVLEKGELARAERVRARDMDHTLVGIRFVFCLRLGAGLVDLLGVGHGGRESGVRGSRGGDGGNASRKTGKGGWVEIIEFL